MKKLTHAEYCSQVCKAKCCYVRVDHIPVMRCPKLDNDNLCTIYKDRYEKNIPYSFNCNTIRENKLHIINVSCGKIKDILQTNQLPDMIKKKCCFYDESVLEVKDEN